MLLLAKDMCRYQQCGYVSAASRQQRCSQNRENFKKIYSKTMTDTNVQVANIILLSYLLQQRYAELLMPQNNTQQCRTNRQAIQDTVEWLFNQKISFSLATKLMSHNYNAYREITYSDQIILLNYMHD